MLNWTPDQWGFAAGAVSGAIFTALFAYRFATAIFLPNDEERTINLNLNLSTDRIEVDQTNRYHPHTVAPAEEPEA